MISANFNGQERLILVLIGARRILFVQKLNYSYILFTCGIKSNTYINRVPSLDTKSGPCLVLVLVTTALSTQHILVFWWEEANNCVALKTHPTKNPEYLLPDKQGDAWTNEIATGIFSFFLRSCAAAVREDLGRQKKKKGQTKSKEKKTFLRRRLRRHGEFVNQRERERDSSLSVKCLCETGRK